MTPHADLTPALAHTPTLAQSLAQDLLSGGPDIPPLPEPGLIDRIVFEGSPMIWVGLGVAAIVVFFTLAARSKLKAGAGTAAILLAIAGGLWLASTLVQTEREVLLDRLTTLVDVTARADTDALEDLLDEDLRVSIWGFATDMPKDRVLSLVRTQLAGARAVREHRVLERQAVLDGPRSARTQVSVRVDGDSYRLGSWWAVNWQNRDDTWRVVEIEALYIPGVVGDEGRP